MYGQTEASPRISYLPFKIARKKIGSIGKAIPGGHIAIRKTKKQIRWVKYYIKERMYSWATAQTSKIYQKLIIKIKY